MGDCKFCGKPAGFLKSEHRVCKKRHQQGKAAIIQLVAAAPARGDMERLTERVNETAWSSYIDPNDVTPLLAAGFKQAVDNALDDHLLSEQEEKTLNELLKQLPITEEMLHQNGVMTRVAQCAVLREIQDGIVPQRFKYSGILPFNLLKSESVIWLFQNVKYLEQKTSAEYVGGSHGMSYRVAKGVYFRSGGFRGRRVETTETIHADTGLMGVTTKHVYFSGASKRFRIRYDRIVAFEPYADGIGLMRDAQTAKPQTFVTGDGWFTYNLIANLAQM